MPTYTQADYNNLVTQVANGTLTMDNVRAILDAQTGTVHTPYGNPQVSQNDQSTLSQGTAAIGARIQDMLDHRGFSLNEPVYSPPVSVPYTYTVTTQRIVYDPKVDYLPRDITVPPRNEFEITGFDYQYNLGLYHVAIGTDAPAYRGVFVSKPFDAPGDIGEVQLKTSEMNVVLNASDRDFKTVTSVEYSVSNKAVPKHESDWTPIRPLDQREVEGERLFPDLKGQANLRFLANADEPITVYKNGYEHQIAPDRYILGPKENTVRALLIPREHFSDRDVLVVSYTPYGNPSIVTFDNSVLPLVAAFDTTGAGELYATTTGRNEIQLRHQPYIDPIQVDTSTYSTTAGMTPYQPLVVELENGTFATNLTNYESTDQAALPAATAGVYYYQSGNTLIFNQPVSNLRVYYSYLQNNVRVRVVMRANHTSYVTPQVDYFHLKAKTRRANSLRQQ